MKQNAPIDHLLRFAVPHPHGLRDGLDRADVRVGALEDVLKLGELERSSMQRERDMSRGRWFGKAMGRARLARNEP